MNIHKNMYVCVDANVDENVSLYTICMHTHTRVIACIHPCSRVRQAHGRPYSCHATSPARPTEYSHKHV